MKPLSFQQLLAFSQLGLLERATFSILCAIFFLWRALRARLSLQQARRTYLICRESQDELKTGNKAWLRRRLHGAIVRVHLDACADEE